MTDLAEPFMHGGFDAIAERALAADLPWDIALLLAGARCF